MVDFATDLLGLKATSPVAIAGILDSGVSFRTLAGFQKATGYPWETIADLVRIPPRTLQRRKLKGRLQPDESERLYRVASVFAHAVQLFDGDTVAAKRWLQTPRPALAGQTPLELTRTEVGAREVENLIGRLEHG